MQAAELASLDEAGFEAELEAYDQVMDRVVEAFAMDDEEAGRELLETLEREIEAGEHGILVRTLTPALLRLHERAADIRRKVEQRRAWLSDLASGRIAAANEANAAVYYLRAIEMLEGREHVDRLGHLMAIPLAAPSPEIGALLSGATDVLAVVGEGASKRRCDFAFARARSGPLLAESYAPGMRLLLRLVVADAARLLQEGQRSPGMDRLSLALGVIGHLSGDETLVSSLTAHRAFDQMIGLLEASVRRGSLPAGALSPLQQDLERIARTDPFGYVASLVTTRRKLLERLESFATAATSPSREAVAAAVKGWDGDQAMYILAVIDTMIRAGSADTDRWPSLEPLGDVLSLPALRLVRGQVPEVAPRLARGELAVAVKGAPIELANVASRMRSARGDLRHGYALLRPASPPKTQQ
jgi:hypothetical protein